MLAETAENRADIRIKARWGQMNSRALLGGAPLPRGFPLSLSSSYRSFNLDTARRLRLIGL